jgi:hypothetical protein
VAASGVAVDAAVASVPAPDAARFYRHRGHPATEFREPLYIWRGNGYNTDLLPSLDLSAS